MFFTIKVYENYVLSNFQVTCPEGLGGWGSEIRKGQKHEHFLPFLHWKTLISPPPPPKKKNLNTANTTKE